MKKFGIWKLLAILLFFLFISTLAIYYFQLKTGKFVSIDLSTGKHIYKTDYIEFSINPKKFSVNYQIDDGPSARSSLEKTISISILNSDNDTSMLIYLNLIGLGGACPNYPKDYILKPIVLDGKIVNKAVFVNKTLANEDWPLGDVYLVDENNCPNVAGVRSNKNGAVTIKYNMNNIQIDSKEYEEAVKDFDEVVSSIKHFWN